MASTISLDDLEKFSVSVYEAIIVIAKRAQQINQEQKLKIEQETGIDDSILNATDDDDFEQEAGEQYIIKLPKPTQVALDEFLAGKLKFDYGDDLSNK